MTIPELEKLIAECKRILNTYPTDHIEHSKITQQIRGYNDRLKKQKELQQTYDDNGM